MSSIRIAVLGDSKLFREGLRRILEAESTFAVVGDGDATNLEPLLQETSPHILLVDGRMEGGIDLLRRRKGSRPWPIVLAAEPDDDWAVMAFAEGARGVLDQWADARGLRKAIAVVHAGEIWARKEVVARIVEKMTGLSAQAGDDGSRIASQLSAREREIMSDAANGSSNKEIAEHMAISQATVKAHLTKIFQKLKVRDRAQLAALYHRNQAGPVRWRRSRGLGGRPLERE